MNDETPLYLRSKDDFILLTSPFLRENYWTLHLNRNHLDEAGKEKMHKIEQHMGKQWTKLMRQEAEEQT